jgi:Fe-S cluster biogenesis protein NfuA/nitrite reductase/ring-hydroxylating ferredoxin subunit
MSAQPDFERRIGRIDQLVTRLEQAADPGLRATAQELVRTLMELHAAGLERLLALLRRGGAAGEDAVERLGRDPLVRSLLLLHGLHPVELEVRVLAALEKARPYLRSHQGNVELVGIGDDGTVRLRLEGSCHGCPSSAMTLKLAIEEAIHEAAPDVTAIVVEDEAAAPAAPALVALEGLGGSRDNGREEVLWETVHGLDRLDPGRSARFTVAERALLGCRVGEDLYLYGDRCPACGDPLEPGPLAGALLACAGCGERFDVVRAGRAASRPDLHLDPYPLLVEGARARVALPPLRLAPEPASP